MRNLITVENLFTYGLLNYLWGQTEERHRQLGGCWAGCVVIVVDNGHLSICLRNRPGDPDVVCMLVAMLNVTK